MGALLTLLHYEWIQTKNSLKERKAKLRALFAVGVTIALAVLLGRVMGGLFVNLDKMTLQSPGLARTIEASLLSLVSLAVFFLILTSGFKTLYERTFESDDLPFLLSNPVPVKTVFTAKLLGSFLYILQTIVLFILPPWIAYGVIKSAPVVFYIAAITAMVLGALLVYSLLALLILFIMRFAPSAKIKQIAIGLSAGAALVIVFASQIAGSRMTQEYLQDPLVLLEQVGQWGIGKNPYLPHLWMSRFALSFLPSFDYSTWANGLPLIIGSLSLFYLSVSLSGSFFLTGWATKGDVPVRARSKTKVPRQTRVFWPRGRLMAIVRKELLSTKRDPLLWYNVLVITIVLGFFIYNLTGDVPTEEPGMADLWVVRTMGLLMPALMGSVLISQLGGISISREGKNWWFLCSSPIEPRTLYSAKLVYAVLIPALYGVLFQIVVYYAVPGAPFFPPYVSIPAIILTMLAVSALMLMLDILFPDFTIKVEFGGNTGKGAGTTKLLMTMLLGFATLGLVGVTISFPAWADRIFPGLTIMATYSITIAAFLIVTLTTLGIAASISVRRLGSLMRNL
ncbi:MAG: hypothetical protein GX986_05260 [Firmicutes bacterium]|nr:hypothetical protein [Bacillota bacterium]